MASKVVMPKLGATMEKGTILSWLIQVGDVVEEGDPIAEIQTDKISLEIEAETSGILLKTLFDEGSEVSVQKIIAYIGQEGEKIEEISTSSSDDGESETVLKDKQPVKAVIDDSKGFVDKIRRTPAARQLARKNQISLENVTGTGRKGMIKKSDVENYLAHIVKTSSINEIADIQENSQVNVLDSKQQKIYEKKDKAVDHTMQVNDQRIKLTGTQEVIAERMTQSIQAPQVTLMSEVDMTHCVALRKELLPVIEKISGYRLSYNEILIKAVAHTLKNYPMLNSSLQNNEIVYHSSIHIGFAVDVVEGLIVPVVKDAKASAASGQNRLCSTKKLR